MQSTVISTGVEVSTFSLIIARNSLKCIPSNETFFGPEGRLVVCSLNGPHTSQADHLSYVVGGIWRGLILLYGIEAEGLKLLQGQRKRHLLNVFHVPEMGRGFAKSISFNPHGDLVK